MPIWLAMFFFNCSPAGGAQEKRKTLRRETGSWTVAEMVEWKRKEEEYLIKWHQSVGWAVDAAVFCVLYAISFATRHYIWGVHRRSSLYFQQAHTKPHTQRTSLSQQPTWEELSFKAVALSGNSWFGRHGGSWLLLVLLLWFSRTDYRK